MINFCTHFDKNYLPQGIALYRSMVRHVPNFMLYVFALDAITFDALNKMKLASVHVAKLGDPQMSLAKEIKKAQDNRTWQEFVWTLTPFVVSNFIYKHILNELIYLDTDSYFFSDPMVVVKESRGADIAIIPHRFPPGQDKSQNGKYNVNWVYFKNSPTAMKCLDEWQTQCLDWCYNRNEGGKYADQKYLDAWPQKYGAHVIEHLGVSLAPWNQRQYDYVKGDYAPKDKNLYVVQRKGMTIERIDPLVMYHFHETQFNKHGFIRRTNYELHPVVAEYCYPPYEHEVMVAVKGAKWLN